MELSRYLRAGATMLVAGMLTACGGGGGGGGGVSVDGAEGGGGGGGTTGPVTYAGNTSPAIVTTSNAAQLTANLLGSGNSSSAVSSLASSADSRDGQADIARRLNRAVRQTVVRSSAMRNPGSAIAVDETVPCDSGSVRYSGSLNDDGTGTLSVSYVGCRTGDSTLNGAATMRVDAYVAGFGFTDYTMSFDRLTLLGPRGVRAELGGSTRVHLDLATRTERYIESVVAREPSGKMTKSENLTFSDVYNDVYNPRSYTESIGGRLYDSVHGYVDITTSVPLVFGTLEQLFPDSGQITLTGASNARIRLTSFSTTSLALALDLNGDGVYEIVVSLPWTELDGPMSADLRDSDGDGMHNSFESVHGFNPLDPADAALDLDSDGASNLAEYLAGTNPRLANESPPATGLSITMTDSPDPVTVGGAVTYVLTVRNSSSVGAAAHNVVVTGTLPAGVNLVSVSTTQGSCTTTGPIVCNLGTVPSFAFGVTVTIVVRPTAAGVFNNSASVTTNSFDPVTSDNVASTTTTAGEPVAGIQGLIDAAVPGETVVVAPGVYYGGIDFKGKNIVLRSSAGPASTIIHGNNTTAVRIGPSGTISGFTITGGGAYWGAGIEASGVGSLISGNIFDGNLAYVGGYGAGIGGNSASPIIERNIFRNNTCDDQWLSAVVSFVNMSSPVIVNNVFENNQCRGVNLSLPEGNTPVVANNTFVRNRTAIRVDRRISQRQQVYRNNIIFQNGIGLYVDFGTEAENPVWTNNLVFGNTTDYQGIASQTGVNANISVDPLFIDHAAGNYGLRPGSPAIDAGAAAGAPAIDFDGTPRPRDGNGDGTAIVDIGAFEAP